MSKIFSFAVLGLFTAATMVGCEASAEVDKPDNDSSGKTTIKKTEVQPDGDRKTTTETKTY